MIDTHTHINCIEELSIDKIIQNAKDNGVEKLIVPAAYPSDIDIVAVVHGSRMELQQKLKEVWDRSAEVGLENDIVVSPTVIPYDEFKKYQDTLPYYRNIMQEGKLGWRNPLSAKK